MSIIINIRGTGGSGKTWVIRILATRLGHGLFDRHLNGHTLGTNAWLVGPYFNDDGSYKPSGGCDNINTQDEAGLLVRSASTRSHVLFEGLLVSDIYSRWRDFARASEDYRWVFLNTPLEHCLENTRQRRVARGRPAEFNPKATEDKYRSTRSILSKCRMDNLPHVYDLTSNEAAETIEGWLA